MGLKDVTPKTESAILSNINDAIRAEATKPQTTDIDPDTGEVTNGTDSPLSVAAYLDDIANVPTVEGVDHKFAEASGYYKDDAATMAQLTLAKTERKKALEATKAEVTPPQPGSGKKLFAKPDKPEGAAA